MISLVSLVNKSWSDKEYHSLLPLASWALIAWSFEVLHVISPALRLQVVHCKFCFVDRRWLYGEKLRSNSPSAGKFSCLTINSDSNQIWPITMHLNTVMNQSHLALQPSKRGKSREPSSRARLPPIDSKINTSVVIGLTTVHARFAR